MSASDQRSGKPRRFTAGTGTPLRLLAVCLCQGTCPPQLLHRNATSRFNQRSGKPRRFTAGILTFNLIQTNQFCTYQTHVVVRRAWNYEMKYFIRHILDHQRRYFSIWILMLSLDISFVYLRLGFKIRLHRFFFTVHRDRFCIIYTGYICCSFLFFAYWDRFKRYFSF